jgi:hypothetical protein
MSFIYHLHTTRCVVRSGSGTISCSFIDLGLNESCVSLLHKFDSNENKTLSF